MVPGLLVAIYRPPHREVSVRRLLRPRGEPGALLEIAERDQGFRGQVRLAW